jgi:hypothetical protein
MIAFCASCARETVDGPVLRGGWLYCSLACAREPGASTLAWQGSLQGRKEARILETVDEAERLSLLALRSAATTAAATRTAVYQEVAPIKASRRGRGVR